MFGKKKNKAETTEAVEVSEKVTSDKKDKKKKKKKERLDSVIQESVLESSLDVFRSIEKTMFTDRDGRTYCIGIMLDVDNIGGLNKKCMNDEAKGSIIHLINANKICVYEPKEVLESECLIFMGLAPSLEQMGEFAILVDAEYTVVLVDAETGDFTDTGATITYDQFLRFIAPESREEEVTIDEFMAAVRGEDHHDDSEGVGDEAEHESYVEAEDDEDDDEYEAYDDDEDDDEEYDDDDEEKYDDDDDDDYEDEDDEDDDYEDLVDDTLVVEDDTDFEEVPVAEPEEQIIVSEEEHEKALARTFYSDDLGLEISMEPFDMRFIDNMTYPTLSAVRGSEWLDGYIGELVADGNADLKRIHDNNIKYLRNKYAATMELRCDLITRTLDIHNENSEYSKLYNAIKDDKEASLEMMDDKITKKKQALQDTWDQELRREKEAAALNAETIYNNKYKAQHDEMLFKIDKEIENDVITKEALDMRKLHEQRQAEAQKLLDYAVTSSLQVVTEEYAELVKVETEAFQKYQDKITAYIDDNRKEDIARINALSEELAQKTKADKVREEYTAKINAMNEEFTARKEELSSEIIKIQAQTEQALREKQAECEGKVREYAEKNEVLNGKVKELMDLYADLDRKKSTEYEDRIKQFKDERDSWMTECDKLSKAHKRQGGITIALVIVAICASLAVGVLFGANMNLQFGSNKAATEVTQEFDKRMDKAEENANKDAKAPAEKTADNAEKDTAKAESK